jgi:hypothetical protein
MSTRGKMDDIYNSLMNGQRRQAVEQMEALGLDSLPDLLDYFADDLNRPELAIDAAKSYFRIKAR